MKAIKILLSLMRTMASSMLAQSKGEIPFTSSSPNANTLLSSSAERADFKIDEYLIHRQIQPLTLSLWKIHQLSLSAIFLRWQSLKGNQSLPSPTFLPPAAPLGPPLWFPAPISVLYLMKTWCTSDPWGPQYPQPRRVCSMLLFRPVLQVSQFLSPYMAWLPRRILPLH